MCDSNFEKIEKILNKFIEEDYNSRNETDDQLITEIKNSFLEDEKYLNYFLNTLKEKYNVNKFPENSSIPQFY